MYYCKDCGRPVEQAIEGELICEDCRGMRETDIAMLALEREIYEWHKWAESHCEGCGVESPGGQTCPDCQALLDEMHAEAWGD